MKSNYFLFTACFIKCSSLGGKEKAKAIMGLVGEKNQGSTMTP